MHSAVASFVRSPSGDLAFMLHCLGHSEPVSATLVSHRAIVRTCPSTFVTFRVERQPSKRLGGLYGFPCKPHPLLVQSPSSSHDEEARHKITVIVGSLLFRSKSPLLKQHHYMLKQGLVDSCFLQGVSWHATLAASGMARTRNTSSWHIVARSRGWQCIGLWLKLRVA